MSSASSQSKHLFKASKALSWLLRHGAIKEGIPIDSAGYVLVADLLKHPKLAGLTARSVRQIVVDDAKGRFSLMRKDGELKIRANQGHSIPTVRAEEIMTPITDAATCTEFYHGTCAAILPAVLAPGSGLNRMGRQHVHFATARPGVARSGIRTAVPALIHVDLGLALRAGMQVWRSANDAEALSGRLRLRQQPFTEDKDAETSLRPLSRPEKDAILQRLRDRKAALQRLALEDALGVEAQEQAQAESNVLSDLGGEPFIGVNEQKAKISAYAADAADALERAKRLKDAAEEAQSEAASVAVLTVAHVPNLDDLGEHRKERKELLGSAKPQDRAAVKDLLDSVDAADVAQAAASQHTKEQAMAIRKQSMEEEAVRQAAQAARQGPGASQLLAMRQMLADLERVRHGSKDIAGAIDGALADAMGFVTDSNA